MKKLAKSIVATILGWQVRRLRKKNNFTVVAVTGSIGKTTTKMAIAQVLSQSFKVQYQEGNYNDLVSVPLVFFGLEMPSLYNPFAWLAIFWKTFWAAFRPYSYDVVVVELGSDGPGQIKQFKRYLRPDIAVVTAITPEHMEYFPDLAAVAREELAIADYSAKTLLNVDLCPDEYLQGMTGVMTYGYKKPADFQLSNLKFNGDEASFDVKTGANGLFTASHERITEPQLYSIVAAVAVASELSMAVVKIVAGISSIKAVSGRMNHLVGINDSVIIDDSYNASPEAAKAALDTLYRMSAPYKIAVLGNMNELGSYSENAHKELGDHCDRKQLELVLTIGPDANKFLAPAAQAKGCKVMTFDNPYTAGDYLKPLIKPGTVILVKGSQNRVFAEETIKQILANPSDSANLVRQSSYWMNIKEKAFKS